MPWIVIVLNLSLRVACKAYRGSIMQYNLYWVDFILSEQSTLFSTPVWVPKLIFLSTVK